MTFFEKADRFKQAALVDSGLGPGEYISHENYKIPHAVAPFGSTVDRQQGGKSKEKDTDLKREREFYAEAHMDIGEEMGLKKPTSVFVSGTKRFNHEKGQEVEVKPGPGNYEIRSFTDEMQRKNLYKQHVENAKIEKQRQINALKDLNDKRVGVPSIPGNDQKLGYTFLEGELKMNTNAELVTRAGQGNVGPGHYTIPESINPAKMNGVQWKYTVQRTKNRMPETKVVGPGSYNPSKDHKPLYKYKVSSAFASETPRKFLGRENSSLASKKTRWTLAGDDDDEDESEYIRDATPGPGYYPIEAVTTGFKKKAKSHQYQMFNVSSERFPQAQAGYTNLGPGKYYKDNGPAKKTFNAALQRGQPVKTQTKTGTNLEPIPGPGHYNIKNTLGDELNKKLEKASVTPFLSSSYRFQGLSEANENPGPGAYHNTDEKVKMILEGDDKIKNIMDAENEKKQNHYFKSNSKRAGFMNRANLETPPVGRYNLSQFDLSKKAERYINEPEDLKRGRVPFDSGAPRFKNNIPEVDEEYEEEVKGNQVKKIFDQLPTFKAITDGKQNEVEVKSKNKNKKSFGNKPRFTSTEKNDVPGPGSYYKQNQLKWDKQTFNSYYHEYY